MNIMELGAKAVEAYRHPRVRGRSVGVPDREIEERVEADLNRLKRLEDEAVLPKT